MNRLVNGANNIVNTSNMITEYIYTISIFHCDLPQTSRMFITALEAKTSGRYLGDRLDV